MQFIHTLNILIKKNYILVILTLSFTVIITYLSWNNSLNERFSDEINHFIAGTLWLSGYIPYQDIQLNHQPLNYIISAIVSELYKTDIIFRYVTIMRIAVAFYSILWILLLVTKKKWAAVLFAVIFEFYKYNFGGYKLLGETLAVYPLIYILSVFYDLFLHKNVKISTLTLLITSVAFFVATFSLLPLWPVLFIIYGLFIFKFRKKFKNILFLSLPALILSFLLFTIIPFSQWLNDTVIYSLKYFIPINKEALYTPTDIITMPLKAFLPPYNIIKLIMILTIFSITISAWCLIKKKNVSLLVIFITLLFLSNSRDGNDSFSGFHLAPWIGILFFSAVSFYEYILNSKSLKIKIIQTVIFTIIIFLNFMSIIRFITPRDKLNDYYIGYSESLSYSNALKAISKQNDRVLVFPNDPLIYVFSGIEPATKLTEYYSWVYPIPEYYKDVYGIFDKPPEFVVDTGINNLNKLDLLISTNLQKNYKPLKHLDNKSRIYIRNDRIEKISETEWEKLSNALFFKPE